MCTTYKTIPQVTVYWFQATFRQRRGNTMFISPLQFAQVLQSLSVEWQMFISNAHLLGVFALGAVGLVGVIAIFFNSPPRTKRE